MSDYIKTDWKDHIVDPETGEIIQQGTPIDSGKLNKIEQGIEDVQINTQEAIATHQADYVLQPANGGTTGGSTTAYTCTSTPAPVSLVDKIGVVITAHADSGASPTLNWSTKGAKPIKKPNGNAAILKAGGIYTLRYNATSENFILQGEGASGNATASDLLSGKTASTDAGDITGTMPDKSGAGVIITPSDVDQAFPQGYYGGVVGDGKVSALTISPGDYPFSSANTLRQTNGTSYIKIKETKMLSVGTIRVKFDLTSTTSNMAYGRVYKNGSPVGIERSNSGGGIYTTYSEDFAVNANDLIQLYYKSDGGGYANVRNFQLCTGIQGANSQTNLD